MQITSSVESIDSSVVEAARERPGQPIRVRVQPQILRSPNPENRSYLSWKGLHWMIALETIDEARQFREALGAFFLVAEQQGLGEARNRLLGVD